jgi:hypothetical protein
MVSSARCAFLASTALGVSLTSYTANATPVTLPGLSNLDFTTYTGSAPKNCFQCVAPTGWTGGSGLIYIDSQTAGADAVSGNGGIATYADPAGSVPGNYVEADGNPIYESGFNYELSGLTPGQQYSLSFYQGASEQQGFGSPNETTTNQWLVALGTPGSSIYAYVAGDPTKTPDNSCGKTCAYTDSDLSAVIAASSLMTVPYGTAVGWNYVNVTVTADATTDVLSFLAWGDSGNTTNLPPIAFLAGVNSPPGLGVGVPEPATMSMIGVGLAGIGLVARRRRRKASS